MFQAIQLHINDNVATAVKECKTNEFITIQSSSAQTQIKIKPNQNIPFGHKIALKNLNKHDIVTKYGRPIGRATVSISKGDHVGAHNVEGLRGRGDLKGEGGEI